MHLERRVLISGGAGFLGSHLADTLLQSGHQVLCVDNFFTGTRRNIEHLLDHKHFELLRHDITHPLFVEVDQIFNLACPASPIHYQRDPVQTTKTSVIGAINMLGLAKRLKIKILQASTSEVYGDPRFTRRLRPIGVTSTQSVRDHATTKVRDAPRHCSSTTGGNIESPIKVARIFNTYGPRTHPNDGRVVSSFIVQALLNEDVTLFGDGEQTRSFCYVDDLIRGLLELDGHQGGCRRPDQPRQPERIHDARAC